MEISERRQARSSARHESGTARPASSGELSIPFTSAISRQPQRPAARCRSIGSCFCRHGRLHIAASSRARRSSTGSPWPPLPRPSANIAVSDLELRRDGPSYTALTLEALHREGYAPFQLYFITGSDAFAEVGTWYEYPRILQLANFVVISRPGAPRPSDLVTNPKPSAEAVTSLFTNPAAPTVLSVEATTPDVSSTDIRRRVGQPATRSMAWCPRASPITSAGTACTCRRQSRRCCDGSTQTIGQKVPGAGSARH